MTNTIGAAVSICKGLTVPISSARDVLLRILREYQDTPGSVVLTIDLTELQVPFEARISVPIKIGIDRGINGSNSALHLTIAAATKHDFFPHFSGVMDIVPQPSYKCQLRLDGNYSVPFKAFGKILDETLLRGVAETSLRTFVDHLAEDITKRIQREEIEYARRSRGMNM